MDELPTAGYFLFVRRATNSYYHTEQVWMQVAILI